MTHVASTPTLAAADYLAADPDGARCLNCHQPLLGPHCAQCGQAASTPQHITMRHLLHDIPHSVWHVDHGVVYTLREMLLRPGPSIRRYLAGERVHFFRPLSLVLLFSGITSFLYLALHIVPYYEDPAVPLAVRQSQGATIHFISKYMAWIQAAMLPYSAALMHWFLRRRSGLTYPEHLVATTLTTGAFAAVNLLFVPALWYYSGRWGVLPVSWVQLALMLGYKAWAGAQLQEAAPRPVAAWRRWTRGVAMAVVEYLLLMLMVTAVVLVLMVLKKYW